jgi:hypothetical protein
MMPRRQAPYTLLAGLILAAEATSALAQNWVQPEEETHWLSFQPDYASVGVLAEFYNQKVTSSGSAAYEETRTFVGPSLGVGASGSIYHPNLAAYQLTLDGSLGWDEQTYRSGGVTGSSRELRFLGTFASVMQLLDSKPFHANLTFNYTHSYQDYDFFNRVYVDTFRYGGGAYYTTGPWKFSVHAYRITEDARDNFAPRSSDTRTVAFDATHGRRGGSTSLDASLSDYTRNDAGFNSRGLDYLLSLSDAEDFGGRKQYHSLVTASYNHLENFSAPSDFYNLSGSLRADHTERLSSQHQVNYSHNTYGDSIYDSLNGSSSLQHRLFDSLTSTLTAQGYDYSARTGSASQDSWQFGLGPGLNYVKILGASSSLSAYENLGLFHTEVQSSGGVLQISSESHSFGSGAGGDFITLRQANIIESSIIVSSGPNATGIIYDPLSDGYKVQTGQLTRIQRLPGSTLPDSVYVRYDFYSGPSGAYDTLNNGTGLRLDFFNQLWSIYARLNLNRNYGATSLVVQDLNDLVMGTEVNWRFLRAGAEYEMYDSSLSPYNALRLFQNFTFRPEDYSTVSLNFSETYLSYGTAGRNEQNYRAVLRYNRRLAGNLAASVELGANQRIGQGVDQTLAVFRPELRYAVGDFSVTVGYDFGYDEYLSALQRVSNRGFVRLQKSF